MATQKASVEQTVKCILMNVLLESIHNNPYWIINCLTLIWNSYEITKWATRNFRSALETLEILNNDTLVYFDTPWGMPDRLRPNFRIIGKSRPTGYP